ncbi:hypothetical protein D3C78_1916980 [compost metagenome]
MVTIVVSFGADRYFSEDGNSTVYSPGKAGYVTERLSERLTSTDCPLIRRVFTGVSDEMRKVRGDAESMTQ